MLFLVHLSSSPAVLHGLRMVLVRPQNEQCEKGMSIQADISPFPIPNVAMIWVQLSNVPMGKVHPRDVHPILNEFEEGGGLPRNWTNGANNSGEPHLVCGAVHVQVRNKLHLQVALHDKQTGKD